MRILHQIERPARRIVGDEELEVDLIQRVHLAVAEQQPVVGLEIPAEVGKVAGQDVVGRPVALIEGKAVVERAGLVEDFLQLELELHPRLAAVVEHVDAHVEDAVGIVAPGGEGLDRTRRADGQRDGRGRIQLFRQDDGVFAGSLSGRAGYVEAAQLVGKGIGAGIPDLVLVGPTRGKEDSELEGEREDCPLLEGARPANARR